LSFFEVLWLAIGLSMDALAVSICAGAGGFTHSGSARLRLAFFFGLFQTVMPLLGWLAGVSIAQYVSTFDHWLAFLLLSFVGIRMIRGGFSSDSSLPACDPTRGTTLVMLSLATSIDALAVGFSMALLGISIWWPVLVIGIVTFSLSYLAAGLGSRLNSAIGSRFEIAGGVVLLLIGLRILIQHLLSG
jgi:manganese efflux pump family protein